MTGSSQKGNPAGVGKCKDPPPLGRKFLNRKVLEHGNVFWGKYGTALPKQPPFGTVKAGQRVQQSDPTDHFMFLYL